MYSPVHDSIYSPVRSIHYPLSFPFILIIFYNTVLLITYLSLQYLEIQNSYYSIYHYLFLTLSSSPIESQSRVSASLYYFLLLTLSSPPIESQSRLLYLILTLSSSPIDSHSKLLASALTNCSTYGAVGHCVLGSIYRTHGVGLVLLS
jgi:hypothetical protein